jgi:hypothetical protein
LKNHWLSRKRLREELPKCFVILHCQSRFPQYFDAKPFSLVVTWLFSTHEKIEDFVIMDSQGNIIFKQHVGMDMHFGETLTADFTKSYINGINIGSLLS